MKLTIKTTLPCLFFLLGEWGVHESVKGHQSLEQSVSVHLFLSLCFPLHAMLPSKNKHIWIILMLLYHGYYRLSLSFLLHLFKKTNLWRWERLPNCLSKEGSLIPHVWNLESGFMLGNFSTNILLVCIRTDSKQREEMHEVQRSVYGQKKIFMCSNYLNMLE